MTDRNDFLREHVEVIAVAIPPVRKLTAKCPECDRVFDLTNETDAGEWTYGHDCEGS